MPSPRLAAPLAVAILLSSAQPTPPAQPAAFVLDGLRDPAYVLIAEDPADDLAPAINGQINFHWADLTRLYVATDDGHLYVYAELPEYTASNSSGQIGLALVLSDSDETAPAPDPWLPANIAYAFSDSTFGQCPAKPISPVRPPDVLIRGNIKGKPGQFGNANDGYTFLALRQDGSWQGTEVNWGGFRRDDVPRHIEYADTAGVELFIPWVDLGLPGPTGVQLSFFTTAGAAASGVFDSIPPDPQAPPAGTDTVLSQLQTIALPLPAPQSVALGCDAYTVDEHAGPVSVAAQLHTVFTQTVSFSYTTSAITAGPADYTPLTGTLAFNPGTTRRTINLPITDDILGEDTESFLLTLTSPLGLSLASPLTATITIVDNDGGRPANLQFFIPFLRR